jgi:DNA-binding protein YbaB
MTTETDPQVTDALQQMQQMLSVIEDNKHRTKTQSFTATDETGTVTVVVNGDRWLTGLRIEHGLLRLGAPTVQQRIQEALRNAQAAAFEVAEDQAQQIEQALGGLVGVLEQQLGDLQRPE